MSNNVDLLKKWKLLQAIVADPSVDAVAKVVAARLLGHYNTKTGRCDPSYQTIADGIGYSRRHVMRAVAALIDANWVSAARKEAGRLASNQFSFSWDRLAEAASSEEAIDEVPLPVGDDDADVTIGCNVVPLVTPLSPPSDARVTRGSDVAVTRVVTPVSPKYRNLNQEIEIRKGSFLTAAVAAPTPAGMLFGECRKYLMSVGKTDRQARSIVGGWRKDHTDGEIIDAISRAQREEAQDPVAFIVGCLKQRRKPDRPTSGAMSAIEAIERVML